MASGLNELAANKKEGGAGYLSHDDVAKIIAEQRTQRKHKHITGLYGHDGTGKTGIALLRRTQDDIDTERPLYLFDFDQGAAPLLEEYYPDLSTGEITYNDFGFVNTDPGIVVIDPVVRFKSGENRGAMNPVATIQQTMSMLFYIQEEGPGESAGCILDGMNSWQKVCEKYMREVELKISVVGKTNQSNWHIRDDKYNQALLLAKGLPCPVSYITHLKDKKQYVNIGDGKKELQVYDTVPDWGSLTPSQMFQRLECSKVDNTKDKTTEMWVIIQKAKGKLYLEGSKHLVASIPYNATPDEATWHGFDWSMFK